jgi:prepilin peptidase CpaA
MSEIITINLLLCGILLLACAALHDVVARTIPNWMPLCLTALGLALRIFDGKVIVASVIAATLLILLGLLWLRGLLGGGDVKLIPAASLVFPPSYVPEYVLFVATAGGILALVYLAASRLTRRPRPGLRRGFVARVRKAEAWRMHRGGPLPYAIAIAAGAVPFVFKTLSE